MSNRRANSVGLAAVIVAVVISRLLFSQGTRAIDPGAWGGDHVGRAVPEYLGGDECLFCHRMDIGPGFASNRHNLTIRPRDEAPYALQALEHDPATRQLARAVIYVMGGAHAQRFLRPSTAYGKLEILSTHWQPPTPDRPGRLVDTERPRWDDTTFANACAGCHATGVEAATRAFSAVSLDCFVCHGAVDPKHSKDPTLVHLSRARHDPADVVTSICAQCHVRSGRSRSTGLPYPNTFVAGDNLFRDFQVDLALATTKRLHPAERHVVENVRDVVARGDDSVTCLSCHDVHRQSSAKHRRLGRRDLCLNCHDATGKDTTYNAADLHSDSCRY